MDLSLSVQQRFMKSFEHNIETWKIWKMFLNSRGHVYFSKRTLQYGVI